MPNSSIGQTEKSIIAYQNLLLSRSAPAPARVSYEPSAGIQLYEYSIAYRWKKQERRWQQAELKVWFGRPQDDRYEYKPNEVVLRYDRGKVLNKKIFNYVSVTPATSASIGMLHETVVPKNDFEDQLKFFEYFVGLSGILHLDCPLGTRLGLQIGVPVASFTGSVDGTRNKSGLDDAFNNDTIIRLDIGAGGVTRIGVSYLLQ